MRKISACIVLGLLCLLVIGCSSATLTESGKARQHRIKRNERKDMLLLQEDWDRFWMMDKPSRLTPDNM